MDKYKKSFVAAPSSDNSEEEANEVSEDSMIENGTSESDSEQETESDDGFSDKEVEAKKLVKEPKRKLPKISENMANKRPKTDTNHYKPPTVKEINQLRETENLFHSNLFRLQIQEMLNELKVKEKYKKFIKTWVEGLNSFLDSLESMPEKEQSDNMTWLKDAEVQVPIQLKNLHTKPFRFQFLKPTEKAFLIGSACTDTITGPNLLVDVCILMPAGSFEKENYLNLIYDQKRALYLSYIASKMIKSQFNFTDIKFSCYRNNRYKPVLEIVPESSYSKKLRFRIFVSGDSKSFKLSRFVPWNSNIRGSLFKETSTNSEEELIYATPFYNATVLFDITMQANQKLIQENLGIHRNLQEGLILLKIWLKQRDLDRGFSGFGSHLITMFLVYLVKQKKIHATMSSYQIARNVWNHLAISSWHEEGKGITLCSDESALNQPTMKQFHAHYDVVFVDSTGFLNVCANLSLDMYFKIKLESERAVELLNNKQVNSFHALFMTKIPVYVQFDHILKICDKKDIKKLFKHSGQEANKHNYVGMWFPQILKVVCRVLRKGLGKRILSMVPIETSTEPWNINESPSHPKPLFTLGFVLNPENAYDILDKGPQANESTAQEFRDFWGEQSQLRRFQDGSITEACVWSNASDALSQKRLIVRKIVLHLLNHHFKLNKGSLRYLSDQFDVAYELNKSYHVPEDGHNDAESTALKVIQSFDSISKNLRVLEDLPLDIHSIQGYSPVFRYCDPIPILPQAITYTKENKIYFQSYKISEAVIELGMSGKWPSDLPAFRRLKVAFYLQIAKSLRTQFNLVARGGIDGVHILKDGYLFKIEIYHQKEIALLKKSVSNRGITEYNDTLESLEMEKRLVVLPKVTSALHGLYQRFSSFGPTVMIAKRWLYSQMLDEFLWPAECTELLVAFLYMKMGPLPNAFQPQTGFFRFLHLLAITDWTSEFFMLNFNEEMNLEEITEIEKAFTTERDSFPPLTIVTSYDTKKDGMWGQRAPNAHVLARVSILARHTLQLLEPTFTTTQVVQINDLFIPSLEGYDVIINLKREMVPTSLVHNFETSSKKIVKIGTSIPPAGFDPVMRGLQELREAYSEFAVFFYNPCEGREIAVIWKPDVFGKKEFKLGSVNGCQPTEDGQLEYNIPQILDDFKIVLRGLWLKVENRRKDLRVS